MQPHTAKIRAAVNSQRREKLQLTMKRYKAVLVAFMRHRDGHDYDKDHEFTQEQLSHVTDVDVAQYMKQKVYGTPTPTEDDRPVLGRSSTLHDIKKSLSYFMPNKDQQWDEMTKVGNPTRSALVNETIRRVAQFEARKQGAPSKARVENAPVTVTPAPTHLPSDLAGASNRQLLLSMLSGLNALHRAITELKGQVDGMRAEVRTTQRAVNRYIRKIDSNPVQMMANNAVAHNNDPTSPPRLQRDENCEKNAVLSPTVRTLEKLWLEYTHGIGGNKAAKYFTRAERGRCKFTYSRRKNVWDLISLLLNRGACTTHNKACHLIRQSYGQSSSVTTIIRMIQADRKARRTPEPLQAALC